MLVGSGGGSGLRLGALWVRWGNLNKNDKPKRTVTNYKKIDYKEIINQPIMPKWGKEPVLNGKNRILYHEVKGDDLEGEGVIEIELLLDDPVELDKDFVAWQKKQLVDGHIKIEGRVEEPEHIGIILQRMGAMVAKEDDWKEPKNAHYYGDLCGPWLARMQIEMMSGDYYFYVGDNVVSKLSAKCVVEYWGRRAKGETGELGIFKEHRAWLLKEYGIYCPRFAGRLDGSEEG